MSYEMNTAADRAFDWDESFDNSTGNYLLLAEQDCPFEVIKLERQRYEGGAVFQEVLISNYDTRKSAQAQLHLFEPAAEERKILWNGLY